MLCISVVSLREGASFKYLKWPVVSLGVWTGYPPRLENSILASPGSAM